MDSELTMKKHVAKVAAACFYHIRRLRPVRRRVDSIYPNASALGYIESAEQSRTAEQNKISKLTVKLQIILTEHDCRM